MVKEIIIKNYHKPALVDDEYYELMNQFEWEIMELDNGALNVVRIITECDGTYSWILMEDMLWDLIINKLGISP